MKFLTRVLSAITLLAVFSSLAFAKPVRDTLSVAFDTGIDANGVPNPISDGELRVKGNLFPKSSIIINRVRGTNLHNLSGKRQVFRKAGFVPLFDPSNSCDLKFTTRNRFVYPKGRARKINLVNMRGTSIHNPNHPEIVD